MKGSQQRENHRVPIALRIKLRFRKVDTFVSKFATNISSNGMFISSRKPKEKGTLLRFELRLADDSTVIAGRGRVAWVRPYDPERPKEPHGMGIEFITLSQGSRELIGQIVTRRIEQGLGENDEIPFAKEAAPPGAAASQAEAAPAPEAPPAAVTATPTAAEAPPAERAESNKTVQASVAGAAQAPLSLEDIDSASIDLRSAVARARALVGSSELDEELEQLFRVSAAPVAETVDQASNNLARMLGGQAVSAKRKRHIAPPTGVQFAALPPEPEPEPEPVPEAVPEPEPEPAAESIAREVDAHFEARTGPHTTPRYARAQTDPSPDILEEFDIEAEGSAGGLAALQSIEDARAAATRITDRAITHVPQGDDDDVGLDALPIIETKPEPAAEPSRVTASEPIVDDEDSLDIDIDIDVDIDIDIDIDIDEGTPVPAFDPDAEYDVTSSPGGIDVNVLDAAGLEDKGIHELTRPGAGPGIDLVGLANLPPALDDAEDVDLEADLDLPDRPLG